MGDSALRSILRIIIETATCPRLLRFTANEDLQNKIPGYLTKFGFGLHAGWAIQVRGTCLGHEKRSQCCHFHILWLSVKHNQANATILCNQKLIDGLLHWQGAIGSLYKIDPSWLSPHVKWAERLEGATKYYCVPILMTDAFRQHLSPAVQRLVRRIGACMMIL